jgi:hypothetical protein
MSESGAKLGPDGRGSVGEVVCGLFREIFDGDEFHAPWSAGALAGQLTYPVVPNFNFDCNFGMDGLYGFVILISLMSCVSYSDTRI